MINKIESLGLNDGPGIRVVIFMQGCNMRCIYCHNPEMWEIKNNEEKDIVQFILRYKDYFGKKGGVTFSGGEPLLHSKYLIKIIKELKNHNINIALDTSGSFLDSNTEELINLVDLVILDIKATTEEEYKKITNYNIAYFNKFLELVQKLEKKLYLRYVAIPDINDSKEHIKKLKQYIKNINNVEKVELLPYHTMARSKYEDLKIDYVLKETKQMDIKKLKELEKILW